MSCVASVTALMLSIIEPNCGSSRREYRDRWRTPHAVPPDCSGGRRPRSGRPCQSAEKAARLSVNRSPGRVQMRAMDVMTTNVITVEPETSVQALATLLSERAISGVPVVDRDNRLVGVVTEGDLLHRAETGTERRTQRRRLRWLDAFATDQEAARDYVKSHGRIVREIMTREVISVSDTTDLADIATLLETKRIRRVPVLRDGNLVGIVSRANLVRALAMTKSEPA